MRIRVTRRTDDFHACIEGDAGRWGRGKNSADEAVGSLIRSFPELFGIQISGPDLLDGIEGEERERILRMVTDN